MEKKVDANKEMAWFHRSLLAVSIYECPRYKQRSYYKVNKFFIFTKYN